MSESQFKQIIPAWVIEDQVTETLKTWFPTYLAELADQWDATALPAPRSYNVRGDYDKWPEDQLPCVVVISAGITGTPERFGDGTIDVPFRIGIAIIAASNSIEGVNKNIRTYAAAVRAILLQKRGLGGYANDIHWTEESYDEGPADGARTMGTAIVEFDIMIGEVVNKKAGPSVPNPPDPDTLPGQAWPEVEETFLEAELQSANGG